MSFTTERVTQVVVGARQEVEKAKASNNVDEWKGEMLCKELDNLTAILKLLVPCTDATTTQAILKQIFTRAKDLWVTFKNEQQTKPASTLVSSEIRTLTRVAQTEGEKEGEKESAEDRRKREEAERKFKEEQDWRERTAQIKREREIAEREQARLREEKEAKERRERLEKEKQLEREREAKRIQREKELEREREAAAKEAAKKKEKKHKKAKKEKGKKEKEKAELPRLNRTITVIAESDLGLSDSPGKDRKHQEWDDEIRKLNSVVNEKIRNMERRKTRRQQVAGSVMILSKPRADPGTSLDTIFHNAPAMTKSTPVFLPEQYRQHNVAPSQNADRNNRSARAEETTASKPAPTSRISAAAAMFERPQQSGDRARPQTMLIRPSPDSRPSASAIALQLDSGNKAKVTEAIQKAGREATTAAQLLIKKEEVDNSALNSAIRMMVINFKTCTEHLDSNSQKKLKDDILDVSMEVLIKTKAYLASPDQNNKGLLIKEVARALTIVKDYNQNA